MNAVAGPVTSRHEPEDCYGSPLHCWVHGVDEPHKGTAYRICFECNHVYRSEAELVKAYNEGQDEANEIAKRNGWPLIRYRKKTARTIYFCPLCLHDW